MAKLPFWAACAILSAACPFYAQADSVNSSVVSTSDNGVYVGDGVEINGPIVRGGNTSSTVISSDVDSGSGVSINNGTVDVGNGAVRVGNGVAINSNASNHVYTKKRHHHHRHAHVVTQSAGTGVSKSVYENDGCTVETKQVGTLSKQEVHCP